MPSVDSGPQTIRAHGYAEQQHADSGCKVLHNFLGDFLQAQPAQIPSFEANHDVIARPWPDTACCFGWPFCTLPVTLGSSNSSGNSINLVQYSKELLDRPVEIAHGPRKPSMIHLMALRLRQRPTLPPLRPPPSLFFARPLLGQFPLPPRIILLGNYPHLFSASNTGAPAKPYTNVIRRYILLR